MRKKLVDSGLIVVNGEKLVARILGRAFDENSGNFDRQRNQGVTGTR